MNTSTGIRYNNMGIQLDIIQGSDTTYEGVPGKTKTKKKTDKNSEGKRYL